MKICYIKFKKCVKFQLNFNCLERAGDVFGCFQKLLVDEYVLVEGFEKGLLKSRQLYLKVVKKMKFSI